MTPVTFPGHNVIIAENQEPYQPLPVKWFGDSMGTCLACFELSAEEVAELVNTRKIWASFWTFGQPFQPVMLTTEKPVFDKQDEKQPEFNLHGEQPKQHEVRRCGTHNDAKQRCYAHEGHEGPHDYGVVATTPLYKVIRVQLNDGQPVSAVVYQAKLPKDYATALAVYCNRKTDPLKRRYVCVEDAEKVCIHGKAQTEVCADCNELHSGLQ